MKRLTLRHINMAALLGLGLLPLLWFRPGYGALAGFDFAVYFDPVGALSKSWYLWSDLMAGGYDISHEVSSAPYYLLFSLPILAGSTLYGAEKFVFCVLFALQGLSMSYMLKALFEDEPGRDAIALTGAVIYSISFPVMAHFGRGNLMALLTYGLLPFLIGMLHKGFKNPAKANKYIAGIALLSIPVAATKGHPADFVVLLGVALFFTLFRALTSGRNGLKILLFASKALAVSLFVNLWWIAPNIHYMSDFGLTKADLVKEGFYNLDTLAHYSSGKTVLKTLLNNSLDLWFDVPGDVLLNPRLYASPLFAVAGLFVPVAGSIALIRRKADRNMVFFSMLFVGAVFMSKGNHPPFGELFEKMYMNIPGFFLFRAPYRVFSSLMAFSITPLAAVVGGTAAWRLLQKFKAGEPFRLNKDSVTNIIKAAALFIFLAGVALYSWPLFTGSHLREKGTLREPGVFHRVPDDYALAGEWLGKAGNGSKLYIPYEVYDANARWGYSGPDPAYELISAPKAVARPNGTVYLRYQKPIESLNALVRDWSYGDLKKVLAFYNIRYVLINDYLSPWVLDDPNYNEYLKGLLAESGLVLRKRFGGLSIYENDDRPERVYGAPGAYILSGDERALPALSLAGYLERPFFVMAKDMPLDELVSFIRSSDGVVFHNSNIVDLICESAQAGFGALPKDGGFVVKAEKGKAYEIYVKGDHGMSAFIDGKPLETKDIEDGFSWKGLGEFISRGGEHTIAVNGPIPQVLAVVPKDISEAARRRFGEAGSRDGFETAYLFDGDMGEGEVTIKADYEAMTVMPERFTRVEDDALKGVRWAFDDKRHIYGANVEIEIGKYPRLSVDKTDKKKLSGITLFYTVDDKDGRERVAFDGYGFDSKNEVDVASVLKKRHREASLFTLKSIRAAYSGPLKDVKPSISLLGSLGAVKYCPSGKGSFKLGEREIGTGDCGEWSRFGPLSTGKYAIKAGGGPTALLLLRKSGKKEKEAAEVSYARQAPTKYFILAGQEKKKNIVFGDSYNAGWTLDDGHKKYNSIRVNGYANGFLTEDGKTEFQLEYSPQNLFDISKLISAISLTAVVALGLYSIKGVSK